MTETILLNIDVPDLANAVAFYEDAFGFRRARILFDGTIAEMKFGGIVIYLIEQPASSSAVAGTGRDRDYADHWTPVHFDIAVSDLDAALARALAAGARLSGDIGRHDWGDIARLRDPFGHGVCLIRFYGKPYTAVVARAGTSTL